ncbi:MAG: formimidoylglutamase [Chitinophagales bacterium]|nr:formimidoylglutamase [Chitinophagales bacterium]
MIADIVQPLRDEFLNSIPDFPGNWKSAVTFYQGGKPDLSAYQIAIIGVNESRGEPSNKGCELGPNVIRKHLYALFNLPHRIKIIDLGNIERGQQQSDTFVGLSSVVNELLRENVFPIILGGDQTLTIGQYKAYQGLDRFVNMVVMDERFSISDQLKKKVTTNDHLYRIFTDQPNILFNFALLGYQSYYVPNEYIALLHKMQFDSFRLGIAREDLRETEPIVRDADLLALNIGCIRQCDAPGFFQPSPNGFFADETCQIFRYAGLSDRLTSLGIYDYNPNFDHLNATAKAIAQMIWYFVDGFSQRKGDYPIVNEADFNKFIVTIDGQEEDIVFLKSKKSDRWWIKIDINTERSKRHKLFPCTIKDYETALQGEIPERWMTAYNKVL